MSTLGQIPEVIRTRDPRYINMPIVIGSTINCGLWTIYSCIVGDIPFFTSQSLAVVFMLVNLTFYFWAVGSISTESIKTLIGLFKLLFPDELN